MVEKSLYCEHKGNYGYRRIILDLKIRSLVVNHKNVQRLMKAPGLSAQIQRKRKNSSYQGKGWQESRESSFNASSKHQNQWKSAIRM